MFLVGFVSEELEVKCFFDSPAAKSVAARHQASPTRIAPAVMQKIDFGCLITRNNALLLEIAEIPFWT
jgi:hypothetical protein